MADRRHPGLTSEEILNLRDGDTILYWWDAPSRFDVCTIRTTICGILMVDSNGEKFVPGALNYPAWRAFSPTAETYERLRGAE